MTMADIVPGTEKNAPGHAAASDCLQSDERTFTRRRNNQSHWSVFWVEETPEQTEVGLAGTDAREAGPVHTLVVKGGTLLWLIVALTSCAETGVSSGTAASAVASPTPPARTTPLSPSAKIVPSSTEGLVSHPKSTDPPSFPPPPTLTPRTGSLDPHDVPRFLMKQYAMTPAAAWGITCGDRYNYLVSGSVAGHGFLYAASADLVGMGNGTTTALAAPSGFSSLTITAVNCASATLRDVSSGRYLSFDLDTQSWR
jgi:hypothetical protein